MSTVLTLAVQKIFVKELMANLKIPKHIFSPPNVKGGYKVLKISKE